MAAVAELSVTDEVFVELLLSTIFPGFLQATTDSTKRIRRVFFMNLLIKLDRKSMEKIKVH
ncbi:hypothetical protein MASR1M65_16980 [Saprospiraceae bacterium]